MTRGPKTLLTIALAAVAATARAAGEDATLAQLAFDTAFGDGGTVTQIGRGAVRLDMLSDAAFDAQGRLVVLGAFQRGTTDDFYRGLRPGVARLLADGRLDPTFGRRGVALLPLGGSPLDLSLDDAGRILVAGTFRRLGALRGVRAPTFQLARLRPNGRLDHQFSGDGLVALGRRVGWIATEVRIAPDGTLRLLTAREAVSGEEHGIVALSPRGELPRSTFGDGGFAHVGTPPLHAIEDPVGGGAAFDIAVQADGSTLVATEGGLRVVTAGGERDSQFGTDGFAAKPLGGRLRAAQGVRVAADGTILCLATDDAGVTAVYRCNSSGIVDTSYGTDGGAEFLHGLPTDTARPFLGLLMDVDPASGACALAAQLEYSVPLAGGTRARGRFAGAFDLASPAELGVHSTELPLNETRTGPNVAAVAVVAAPDGRSLVVVGSTSDTLGSRPRPLLERIARDGATPLPRTNVRIAFDVPPTVELDAELSRWFLVTSVRMETTEPVATRGVRLSLYVSDDDVLDAGDWEYSRELFLPVGPNGSATATIRRDPLGAQHGPTVMAGKRLIAAADGDGRLLETDETDNVAVSAAFE